MNFQKWVPTSVIFVGHGGLLFSSCILWKWRATREEPIIITMHFCSIVWEPISVELTTMPLSNKMQVEGILLFGRYMCSNISVWHRWVNLFLERKIFYIHMQLLELCFKIKLIFILLPQTIIVLSDPFSPKSPTVARKWLRRISI